MDAAACAAERGNASESCAYTFAAVQSDTRFYISLTLHSSAVHNFCCSPDSSAGEGPPGPYSASLRYNPMA